MNSEDEEMSVRNEGPTLTRRNLFQGAGVVLASTMLPASGPIAEPPLRRPQARPAHRPISRGSWPATWLRPGSRTSRRK